MKVRTVWMSKGLILLWSFHFTFCTALKFDPNEVCVEKHDNSNETVFHCYEYGFAYFGNQIRGDPMEGVVVLAEPRSACSEVKHKSAYNQSSYPRNWFLLIDANKCDFDVKGFRATRAGFDAAIIRSLKSNDIEPIGGGSDADKVHIPVVYVGKATGEILEQNDFTKEPGSRIYITAQQYPPIWDYEFYMIPFAVIVGICFILMAMFMISRYYRHYLEQRRSRLSPTNLRKIPTKKFKKGDDYYDVCAICLEEYKDGERLRILPCEHAYHCKCVDPWLTEGKRTCPVCKRPVSNDRRSRARKRKDRNDVESGSGETINHDADETTPLIGSTSASVASNSLTV